MPGKLIKTLEVHPYTEAIAQASDTLCTQESIAERAYNDARRYRIELAKTRRQVKAARLHKKNPATSWVIAKLAGGDKYGVEGLEATLRRTLDTIEDAEQHVMNRIAREEENLTNSKQKIFHLRNQIDRLEIKNRNSTIYSLDIWDHNLRNSELYIPGSLKIREFENEYNNASRYKFSIKTKATRALVNNLDRERYPIEEFGEEVFINIPEMYVDMTRLPYGSTEVRFRAVNSTDRIAGYVSRGQLHPHQTNITRPCFGDFDAPIAEAITELDIPLAITVLELFIKQVDSQDGAGCHWKRWWDRDRQTRSAAEFNRQLEDSEQQAG